MNGGGKGGSLVMQVFMRCTDREGERGEESWESKSKGTRKEMKSRKTETEWEYARMG